MSSMYIASLLTQFSLLVHHDTIYKNAKEIVKVDHEALCDNEFNLGMAWIVESTMGLKSMLERK